jgi:hypothetical protein
VVFGAREVYPFGRLDTVGVGIELRPSLRGPGAPSARAFFVCNGAVVSVLPVGHALLDGGLWPVVGTSDAWITLTTNFGERPFQVTV